MCEAGQASRNALQHGEEADELGPSRFEQVRKRLLEGESSVKINWERLLYSFGVLKTQSPFSKVLWTKAVSCACSSKLSVLAFPHAVSVLASKLCLVIFPPDLLQ